MIHQPSLDEAEALAELAELIGCGTTREIAQRGARFVSDELAGASVHVWLYDPGHEELSLVTSSTPESFSGTQRIAVSSRCARIEGVVAETRRACVDLDSMIVPLLAADELMGVLRVDWTTGPSSEGQRVLETTARVLAALLRGRHQASALERHTRALEQSLRVRDALVALDSHTLRTPLTSLQLSLQVARKVLCKRSLDEQIATELGRAIDTAERQCHRLSSLFDAVLPGGAAVPIAPLGSEDTLRR